MTDPEVAQAEREVFEAGLLDHAARQTKALESIVNILWFLVALGLFGAVLWAITAA